MPRNGASLAGVTRAGTFLEALPIGLSTTATPTVAQGRVSGRYEVLNRVEASGSPPVPTVAA